MNAILWTVLLIPFILFGLSQGLTAAGAYMKNNIIEYYGRSLASFIALILCAIYGTIASALSIIYSYDRDTSARALKPGLPKIR